MEATSTPAKQPRPHRPLTASNCAGRRPESGARLGYRAYSTDIGGAVVAEDVAGHNGDGCFWMFTTPDPEVKK